MDDDDRPEPLAVQVRVLGQVGLGDRAADRALGGGRIRELLAYLVAQRGEPASTAEVIAELWPIEPPATAPTVVHGLVRKLRLSLGADAIAHTDDGYHLALPASAVDLWVADGHLSAGDHAAVRHLWRTPAFGVFAERPWAREAVAPFRGVVATGDEDDTAGLLRSRRRVPVSRLVGRRPELATLATAIRRSRLVTIVGLGGVGKTRLALEALSERPADEVAQVDVGAATGAVGTRVALDLGLVATGDPDRDLRATASLIGRRSLLLLLDGGEHDLDGTALAVETLLGACPNLRIIATSQVALGVPGEHVVPLLPFSAPGDARGDAVQLLLDRAQSMGLAVSVEDRARAAEICARAAGVPLAIELGVTDLLLAPTPADPPVGVGAASPEAAVTDAVGQALDRLSTSTARTACRLALLVAGFTPTLVAEARPEGASVPAIVNELVAGGLVVADRAGPGRRLRFLDPIRDALHQRCEPTDGDAARAAITTTFAAVRPVLAGPVVPAALAAAVAELPNGQALLDRLRDERRPVARLALATTMADTWAEDGHWAHGAALVADALAAVHPARPDENPADDPHRTPADAATVPVDPIDWARGVRAWAQVVATYEGARRLREDLEDAVLFAAAAGQPELEAYLHHQLANAHGYGGDLAQAGRHLRRVAELAAELDSAYVTAGARALQGMGRLLGGDAAGARATLVAVAEDLERLGALSDAARVRRNLAVACRADGDLPAAVDALQHAERLAAAAGARGTLATIRTDLADLQVQQGTAGRDVLESALEAVLAVGNTRAAGLLRTRLGALTQEPATVALGVLDLIGTDQAWAGAALATLLELVPAHHRLHDHGPAVVDTLRAGWGTPLDATAAALVAPHQGRAAEAPDDWELQIVEALTDFARTPEATRAG
jgi:tetratricopeptide (TPR) repeat protein